MTPRRRLPFLDGLRGIAALAVMAFHFNIFFLPQAQIFELLPFLTRAYLSVDLFFILSGFVMAYVYGNRLSYDRKSHWREFSRARFLRIYLLFFLSSLSMTILFLLFRTGLSGVTFSDRSLLLQPLLLQQWCGLSWNYPSWSISTEAEAYVFFIFFAGYLLRGKHPALLAVSCFATLLALCVAKGGSLNCYGGISALIRTISEFSLGVLLYRAHLKWIGLRRTWTPALSVFLILAGKTTNFDALIVSGLGCFISYGVNATGAFALLLNSSPLIALGNWSYSIYMWHAPIHYGVMVALNVAGYPSETLSKSTARFLILLTGLVVIWFSATSYRYLELGVRHSVVSLGRRQPSAA